MTAQPESRPDLYVVPPVPEDAAEQTGRDWRRIGQTGLAGCALVTAIGLPAVARGYEAVEHMPPTHVPISVGGASVDAELVPGGDTVKLELLGHAFVHPSDVHVGRKHYGTTITFHTETTAASLLKKDGTPDNKKIETLVSKFSDLSPQRHEIESALTSDVRNHAGRAAGETLLAEGVIIGLYGLQRRRRRHYSDDQLELIKRHQRPIALTAAIAIGAAATIPIIGAGRDYFASNHHERVTANPAFTDTSLEGWGVYGPFAGLIDVGWKTWNKTAEKKNRYYNTVSSNLQTAVIEAFGSTTIPKPKGVKRIVFFDDTQGMTGPARIVGELAQLSGADVIAGGGDIEDSDIPYNSVLDTLKEYAKGTKVILATGVHDPETMSKQAGQHGFAVANNEVQTIAGIDFLAGANATAYSTLGVESKAIQKNVSNSDVTATLMEEACDTEKPTVVLVHDHAIGTPVAKTGCAAVVLMGRSYFPPAPVRYQNTVAITSGSSGGHNYNEGLNITGIVANQAPMYIIDIDEKTNQFVSMRRIAIDPVPVAGADTSTPSARVVIDSLLTRAQLYPQAASTRPNERSLASDIK